MTKKKRSEPPRAGEQYVGESSPAATTTTPPSPVSPKRLSPELERDTSETPSLPVVDDEFVNFVDFVHFISKLENSALVAQKREINHKKRKGKKVGASD